MEKQRNSLSAILKSLKIRILVLQDSKDLSPTIYLLYKIKLLKSYLSLKKSFNSLETVGTLKAVDMLCISVMGWLYKYFKTFLQAFAFCQVLLFWFQQLLLRL